MPSLPASSIQYWADVRNHFFEKKEANLNEHAKGRTSSGTN